MSGPEMLLKAAISAFVPKQTAENIAATIEGMLRDGSLDGIATLTTDIREIKQSLARLEFQNAKLFAALQVLGNGDGIYRGSGSGPVAALVTEQRPEPVADNGTVVDAGSEPDTMGGGSDRTPGQIGEAAE